MKQSDPGRVIRLVQPRILQILHDEEERLAEPEQDDDVDHAEGEHVPRDHAVDHGDEGPRQLDGAREEHEVEPDAGDGDDEHGLLEDAVEGVVVAGVVDLEEAEGDGGEEEEVADRVEELRRGAFL